MYIKIQNHCAIKNPIRFIAGLCLVAPLFLGGCASLKTGSSGSSSDGAVYHESAYYDKNKPPKALELPQVSDQEGEPVINPQYIRAQADYHFTLADSYSLSGNHEKAVEHFKMTLVYDPESGPVRLRLSAEYIKMGLIGEALEQAEESIRQNPEYVDARLLVAGLYSTLRMYEPAIKQYQEIIKMDPENAEAPLYIGAVYAEQKRFGEAHKYFESLIENKNFTNKHLPYYYLSRIQLEQDPNDTKGKAEGYLKQAIQAQPSYPDSVIALGKIYRIQAKSEKARDLLQKYQNRYGPDPKVAEDLAQIYLQNEEYDKAYEQLEVIEARRKDNLNVKVKMALILIEKKDYTQAILKLEEVLSQVPDSDKIRFYLGAVYEEIDERALALENFAKIPPISSFYSESVVHSAYLQKLEGRIDEAIETVKAGIANRDDVPQFYTLYASLLDDTRNYREAIKMLEGATKKFPNHIQVRFFLGSMYDRVKDYDKTIREMKNILAIDENHIQAINFLAYTYAENSMNLDQAEVLARKAMKLQPNDGYIMDTLGWVLFKKGQTESAIKILQAAFDLQSKESVIAEHLGDAYFKQQLVKEAKKMYIIAEKIEFDENKKKKIRAKIIAIEEQYFKTNRTPASK